MTTTTTHAPTLELSPFPALAWTGHGWEGEITLATWRGFQSRQGPYAGMACAETSSGHVQLAVAAPAPPDVDRPIQPTEAQIAAYRYLVEHEEQVTATVLAAVYAEYPDDELPWLPSPAALRDAIGLAIVHILPAERNGIAYVGFELGCAWDEEHGHGVLLHCDQVVATGQADTSFNDRRAESDAEAPQPRRWKAPVRLHVDRWRRRHPEAVPRQAPSSSFSILASWVALVLTCIGSFFWSVRAGLGSLLGLGVVAGIVIGVLRRLDEGKPWPFRVPEHAVVALVVPLALVALPAGLAYLLWGTAGAVGASASATWVIAPFAAPLLFDLWGIRRTHLRLRRALAAGGSVSHVTRSRWLTDTAARNAAFVLNEHGRYREAIDLLDRTLPSSFSRYDHLAAWVDAALQLGDAEEAERAWRRCVIADPRGPTERERAKILDARTTLGQGNPASALALSVELDEGAWLGLRLPKDLVRADGLVVAQRFDEARAIIEGIRARDGADTLRWLARQRRPCAVLVVHDQEGR